MRGLFNAFAMALVLAITLPWSAKAVTIDRVVSEKGIEAWLVQDHSLPLVSIEFLFTQGASIDPVGKEGVANLLSTMLDEGAGDMDSRAFQQALADQSIELSFNAGRDSFSGSVRSLSRTLESAIHLTRLALTAPRFDDEALGRMKTSVLSSLRRDVTDPNAIAGRVLRMAAFDGHPYGRPSDGTTDTVSALTSDDLRAAMARIFTRESLFIGVSGNITPAQLAPILDELFGELPAVGRNDAVLPTEAQNLGRTILVRHPGAQSLISVAHPGIARGDPDWYAALVMNYILGGGGFSSRLTDEIREKRGLTYGVGTSLVPFDHVPMILGRLSTANADASAALSILRDEWARMAAGGPTDDEVERAVTYLTGSFPLRFTSTARVAGLMVAMQRDDLGIDYLDQRNRQIEALTTDDVSRVAADLLDSEDLLVVIVGNPEGLPADTVHETAPGWRNP